MAYIHNPHPGEILKEEFLDEFGISQNELGRAIDVPPNRIHAIVKGERSITADTDLRLCKFFRLSEGYFLRLQNAYDTMEAKRHILPDIKKIVAVKVPLDGSCSARLAAVATAGWRERGLDKSSSKKPGMRKAAAKR